MRGAPSKHSSSSTTQDTTLLEFRPCINFDFVLLFLVCTLVGLAGPTEAQEDPLGEHGFAKSGDVRLHYVTAGEGKLVVMIHGFPDYWYTWRNQMPALAKRYQVVAYDQRGYNKSDKPEGVEQYAMPNLVKDVGAIADHFEQDKFILVGHDWGGAVAWSFAMAHPDRVERLIILNTPHPNGLGRELATNPQQQENSAYARRFQKPETAGQMRPEHLVFWIKDESVRAKYLEAMGRSSMEGMLNYYKANYPRQPYQKPTGELPKVKCPVLMIHGLGDTALLASGLSGTWDWIDNELTMVDHPLGRPFRAARRKQARNRGDNALAGGLAQGQKGVRLRFRRDITDPT